MSEQFTLGRYTIKRDGGSRNYYAHWYDKQRKRGKRRSLGTDDPERAKEVVASWLHRAEAALETLPADRVAMVTVIDHYLQHRVPELTNQDAPKRAFALLIQFLTQVRGLKASAPASAFTLPVQIEFMNWCAGTHGHTAGGIERNMVAIRAALQFAAKDQLVTIRGEKRQMRLLDQAPTVKTTQSFITRNSEAEPASDRDWIPSFDQLAAVLDTEAPAYLKRYDIIALYTWARPEAIWDLNCRDQVDNATGLIDLNPPGRKQNNKHRPRIRLCRGLAHWITTWDTAYPLRQRVGMDVCRSRNTLKSAFMRRTQRWQLASVGIEGSEATRLIGQAIAGKPDALKQEIARAEAQGCHGVTPYTLRHFMATRVRAQHVAVSREQRQAWLGHRQRDATSYYESHDPEFLRECEIGTDMVMERLDALTSRVLVPEPARQGLRIVSGSR
jgi:integrase